MIVGRISPCAIRHLSRERNWRMAQEPIRPTGASLLRAAPGRHSLVNYHIETKLRALSPATSPALSKSLPPRSRQYPPRQRNPPPIDSDARLAHPHLHHRPRRLRLGLGLDSSTLQPRPQQRSLHRQHPAHRPQNPRRLRGGHQQRHHFRLPQNGPQLTPIPRRLIRRCPHQPTKPTRQLHRRHSPHPTVRNELSGNRGTRPTPPNPPRLKPSNQPFHLPTDAAQPPIQQQHQRGAQQPPPTPAAHSPAQTADHGRKVQIRGCG